MRWSPETVLTATSDRPSSASKSPETSVAEIGPVTDPRRTSPETVWMRASPSTVAARTSPLADWTRRAVTWSTATSPEADFACTSPSQPEVLRFAEAVEQSSSAPSGQRIRMPTCGRPSERDGDGAEAESLVSPTSTVTSFP